MPSFGLPQGQNNNRSQLKKDLHEKIGCDVIFIISSVHLPCAWNSIIVVNIGEMEFVPMVAVETCKFEE